MVLGSSSGSSDAWFEAVGGTRVPVVVVVGSTEDGVTVVELAAPPR